MTNSQSPLQDAQRRILFEAQNCDLADFLKGQNDRSIEVLIDTVKREITIKFLSVSMELAAKNESIQANDPNAYVMPDLFDDYKLVIEGSLVKTGFTGSQAD